MAPPSPTEPEALLVRCEPWPTMFSVPQRVQEALGELTSAARRHAGNRIFRRDVIATLVTVSAPEAPTELERLYTRYISPRQAGGSPLLLPRSQVMVTLPAPVSQRLDVLVERTRENLGTRVVRSGLVGALVLHAAPRRPRALDELVQQYTRLQVKDAGVEGEPLATVRSRRRPDAGVRPYLPPTRRRGAAGRGRHS